MLAVPATFPAPPVPRPVMGSAPAANPPHKQRIDFKAAAVNAAAALRDYQVNPRLGA